MTKRITVFGGSTPRPGEPAYQQAYNLGSLIAGEGYAVLTGGYSGTMEAVSRGANENGGKVYGVTCADIEAWRPLPPNQWVQEEMRYQTLRDRMYALIDHCDIALALPGGIGTLAEIAAMWSSMQTGEIERPPIIVIGEGWRAVFDEMRSRLPSYVRNPHWDLVNFASDIRQGFDLAHGYLSG